MPDITDSQRAMMSRVLGHSAGKLLKRGSRGVTVRALQLYLRNRGYDIKADGIFGTNTETALRDLQGKSNLLTDGRAGNRTLAMIRGSLEVPMPTPRPSNEQALAKSPPIAAPMPSGPQMPPQSAPEPPVALPPVNADAQQAPPPSPPPTPVQDRLPPDWQTRVNHSRSGRMEALLSAAQMDPTIGQRFGLPEATPAPPGVMPASALHAGGAGFVPEAIPASVRIGEETAPVQPGMDNMDPLRAALIGRANAMQQPPAMAQGMPPVATPDQMDAAKQQLIRALLLGNGPMQAGF